MKKLTAILLSIISLTVFSQECSSLDMSKEREKLSTLDHLPNQLKEEVLVMKRKVKQAQVYSCVDKILGGQAISLTSEEQTLALHYLALLNDMRVKNGEERDQILHAIEVIENL